jgi:hypothetical protein
VGQNKRHTKRLKIAWPSKGKNWVRGNKGNFHVAFILPHPVLLGIHSRWILNFWPNISGTFTLEFPQFQQKKQPNSNVTEHIPSHCPANRKLTYKHFRFFRCLQLAYLDGNGRRSSPLYHNWGLDQMGWIPAGNARDSEINWCKIWVKISIFYWFLGRLAHAPTPADSIPKNWLSSNGR